MKLIFAYWKLSKVSSKWCYHFKCVWPGKPKLPKIKILLFLCNIVKKKWMAKLIFCMQVSMETYYKLILWFSWRWSSFCKVPEIRSLQYLYNISKNKLDMELVFCMQINIIVAYKLLPTLWAPDFQSDTFIIDEYDETFSKYSKVCLCVRMFSWNWLFSFYWNSLGTRFSYKMMLWLLMSMMKHSQSTQRSLCNISKKVRKGVHFLYADRRQGF